MAWRWYCTWDNGARDWKDSHCCLAHSKVLFKTEKKAIEAAKKHTHYGVYLSWFFSTQCVKVEKVDGRKFKGMKVV